MCTRINDSGHYGVTNEAEREPLLSLARNANRPSWWQNYSDVLPNWFQPYIGLEESATLIRSYEVQFVPGLLQTEDYARAVIAQGGRGSPRDDVERRVNVRMQRQRILARPDPPRLWMVLDEAALRRSIGGAKVMRAQLEHLIALAEQPNITLQVMPFAFGGHIAEGGAFSILQFPEADLPYVVYLEQLAGAAYLDKLDDVDRYLAAMNRLCVDSVSPERAASTINKIINEI
ncbi:DUF5753 domain-containing protein [Candidatus Protofrankia datiscae]|uniref:DUF5753 domain-containing protein n=1 Tax=Candidatus Protofrankia datiscae TaxID=2716812 RepID=UPI0005BE9A7A|nr:DUF5753 domain-containing protein [Candidatus Protofrankia datiscae]